MARCAVNSASSFSLKLVRFGSLVKGSWRARIIAWRRLHPPIWRHASRSRKRHCAMHLQAFARRMHHSMPSGRLRGPGLCDLVAIQRGNRQRPQDCNLLHDVRCTSYEKWAAESFRVHQSSRPAEHLVREQAPRDIRDLAKCVVRAMTISRENNGVMSPTRASRLAPVCPNERHGGGSAAAVAHQVA